MKLSSFSSYENAVLIIDRIIMERVNAVKELFFVKVSLSQVDLTKHNINSCTVFMHLLTSLIPLPVEVSLQCKSEAWLLFVEASISQVRQ